MKHFTALVLIGIMLLTAGACAESATGTLQEMYAQAELLMATGDYSGAAAKFDMLGAYSDASQMAMYCKAVAVAETLGLYDVAVSAFNDLGDFKDSRQMSAYYTARGYQAVGDSIDISSAPDNDLETAKFSYDKGAEAYAGLALFKDCWTRMSECRTKSEAVKAEQNTRAAAKLETAYQAALALEESGEYQKAIDAFRRIQDYKDSQRHIMACENAIIEGIYREAIALEESGEYQKAIDAFKRIQDYKDSRNHITACENAIIEGIYREAIALEESGEYQKAIESFKRIQDYKDSRKHITACDNAIMEGIYREAIALEEGGEYQRALEAFKRIQDYKDSRAHMIVCENEPIYLEALTLEEKEEFQKAVAKLTGIKGYKDCEERIKKIYRRLYRKAGSKKAGDYPLYGGFTLGMSHQSFLDTAQRTGFTTDWIQNMEALRAGTWGYYYWDQKCTAKELGDFSIQLFFRNENGNMADSDTILCMEYDFGAYGTKGSQTIDEAKIRFGKLNEWLTGQFGDAFLSNSAINHLVILPEEFRFVKAGFEYMSDSLPCSMWMIPLEDGGVMSITNVIYQSYGIQNRIYFMLYDSGTVDQLLE